MELMMKRTYKPSIYSSKKKHGFRKKLKTHNGRCILGQRQLKKRNFISL